LTPDVWTTKAGGGVGAIDVGTELRGEAQGAKGKGQRAKGKGQRAKS
jgi:hypothetical protein